MLNTSIHLPMFCSIAVILVNSCLQPGRVTGTAGSQWNSRDCDRNMVTSDGDAFLMRVSLNCLGQHPQHQDKMEITHQARLIAAIYPAEVSSDRGFAL